MGRRPAEKASSQLVFQPSIENRRKNSRYFRSLLKVSGPCNDGFQSPARGHGIIVGRGALQTRFEQGQWAPET